MDAQERRSRCGSRTTGAPLRRPAGGTGVCLSVARMWHERTARGRALGAPPCVCVWDRFVRAICCT
eukprot:5783143-Prymnesium_polylepis.1